MMKVLICDCDKWMWMVMIKVEEKENFYITFSREKFINPKENFYIDFKIPLLSVIYFRVKYKLKER